MPPTPVVPLLVNMHQTYPLQRAQIETNKKVHYSTSKLPVRELAVKFKLPLCSTYRHAHLQQQFLKDSIQLLRCPDPRLAHPDPLARDSRSPTPNRDTYGGGSMATAECDSGPSHGADVVGVTHVGLLRAGAARQVVAALSDGQVFVYSDNGELSS